MKFRLSQCAVLLLITFCSLFLRAGDAIPNIAWKRGIGEPQSVLSPEELSLWQRKEALRKQVIKVDDFPQDFGRAEILQKLAAETVKAKAA